MKENELTNLGTITEGSKENENSIQSVIKKLITQGINQINDTTSLQELYALVTMFKGK